MSRSGGNPRPRTRSTLCSLRSIAGLLDDGPEQRSAAILRRTTTWCVTVPLSSPQRAQLTLARPSQLDWRPSPASPVVSAAALALLLAFEHYALAAMGRHDTRMVLAIALAVPVLRVAAAAAFLRRSFGLSALVSNDTRSWASAGCEVVRAYSQVYASRWNAVWVWASTDVRPLLPSSPSSRSTR